MCRARLRSLAFVSVLVAACGFDSSGQTGSGSASVGSDGSTTGTSGADDGPATLTTSATATTASTTAVDTTASTGPDADTTAGDTTTGDPTQGTTTAGDTTTGAIMTCPSLLWVGAGALGAGTDGPLVDRAQSLGYQITFVIDSDAQASHADGQCAVVISGTADGVDVVGKFRDVTVPVLTWEYAIYDEMGFAMAGNNAVAEATNAIEIVDAAHPLAAGYPAGMLTIFTGTGRIGYAVATGAHIVAAFAGQPDTATLFEYQPGEALADGGIAAGLRIGLPHMSAPDGVLEPAALDLFATALVRATAL